MVGSLGGHVATCFKHDVSFAKNVKTSMFPCEMNRVTCIFIMNRLCGTIFFQAAVWVDMCFLCIWITGSLGFRGCHLQTLCPPRSGAQKQKGMSPSSPVREPWEVEQPELNGPLGHPGNLPIGGPENQHF